ncbi:MAG: M13 family metallopeptidase, partial [Muribaculaceae bacterium]|nr:M13 family metallopeptidase [Muribaculaceae bacterium]
MIKRNAIILSAALCTIAMTSCGTQTGTGSAHGIDKANLDTLASPKEDFYQYACGGWMKNNPLPDEFSRFGTFDQLGENSREQLRELIAGLDRTAAEPGSNAQKIADIYAQGMDSVTLNKQGAAPLAKDLATLNSVSKDSMAIVMATLPGVSAFFGTGVEADMMNASMNTMYLMQGGLGLGDRDYYLKDTDEEKKVREAYKTYITELATLAGYSEADAQRMAANVMTIENQLAKASMSREELRDPAASYNPMAIVDIEKTMPAINIANYFKAQGIEKIDTLVVGQPEFLKTVNNIIANTDEQVLRDYLVAGYLSSAASYLSDDFVNAEFKLSQAISGVKEMQPRWKRAQSVPNSILGEALGQLYVEKYFPASSKEKMLTLVKNLQTSLGEHIDSLTWMSDATKAKAHEKLNAFKVKIGYPDKWRDYSDLTIDPE